MAHLSQEEKAKIAGKSARDLYGKEMRKKGYGNKAARLLTLKWWNKITGVGDSAAPFPFSHFPETAKDMEDWVHEHTGGRQSYTRPDVSTAKDKKMYKEFLKQNPQFNQEDGVPKTKKPKKRKPTRPRIAEKSAARVKKVQTRKAGGQAYVDSFYGPIV